MADSRAGVRGAALGFARGQPHHRPHHGAGDLIGWLEAGGLVVTTLIPAFALRSSVIAEKGGSH